VPSFSQLHENYVLKSGEGLSITFIIIWLAGDALNMIGALREGLLPTMIILAGYYCLCDIALIWQVSREGSSILPALHLKFLSPCRAVLLLPEIPRILPPRIRRPTSNRDHPARGSLGLFDLG
jgi:hypothetical protein